MGPVLGFPFPELLDDLALLVLGRPFGGLQAGGGVPLLLLGDLVTRLGIRLVPLALLHVAKAVYAHGFSFPNVRTSIGASFQHLLYPLQAEPRHPIHPQLPRKEVSRMFMGCILFPEGTECLGEEASMS